MSADPVRGRRALSTATPRMASGETMVHQSSAVMEEAASQVGQAVSARGMAGSLPGRPPGTRPDARRA